MTKLLFELCVVLHIKGVSLVCEIGMFLVSVDNSNQFYYKLVCMYYKYANICMLNIIDTAVLGGCEIGCESEKSETMHSNFWR